VVPELLDVADVAVVSVVVVMEMVMEVLVVMERVINVPVVEKAAAAMETLDVQRYVQPCLHQSGTGVCGM
jgi:dihydroxyacetone kinase DhaKLM complex PTS-EIIA-like component DhaM